MNVLFVHKNFPAQFGHVAAYLVKNKGYRCTFVSQTEPGAVAGIQKIEYRVGGGATKSTHYCSRTFENQVWHAAGIYEALKPMSSASRPDLIVGHSGLGPTMFLQELFPSSPVINYFEYFYRSHGSDMDFRRGWHVSQLDRVRSRARNASILLDLEYCQAGYTPTRFQHGLLPEAYRPKVRTIHDGVPTDVWRRQAMPDRAVGKYRFAPGTRIVTYVSRGLESMRGFDIFMQAAKRIYEGYPNVVFLVVGSDRIHYGGDLKHVPGTSFKEHVLKQDHYDLDRILFLGRVKPQVLSRILNLSDLHIYLTAPFVLSWSLLDAMACECVVLASDTEPVREVIRHENNGLLCDFFDVDGLVRMAVDVLNDPGAYRELGHAATRTIQEHYSLEVIMPKMTAFYEEIATGKVLRR